MTAKNSLLGFSTYSIWGSADTWSISSSGTTSTAYSLRISSTWTPMARTGSRLPEYLTISSQVRLRGSNPTFKSWEASRSRSPVSRARFRLFSSFWFGIGTPSPSRPRGLRSFLTAYAIPRRSSPPNPCSIAPVLPCGTSSLTPRHTAPRTFLSDTGYNNPG